MDSTDDGLMALAASGGFEAFPAMDALKTLLDEFRGHPGFLVHAQLWMALLDVTVHLCRCLQHLAAVFLPVNEKQGVRKGVRKNDDGDAHNDDEMTATAKMMVVTMMMMIMMMMMMMILMMMTMQ